MKSQKGSAHVVTIVVLVLALITALGWIFWQNFINNDSVSNNNSTETSKEDGKKSKESELDANKSSLNIEEWQVKIPGAKEYVLTRSTQSDVPDGSDTYVIYEVSTVAISKEARALECPDDKLGYIVRTTSVQAGDSRIRTEKIAGHYYLYTKRSQAACVGSDGTSPEKLNGMMESADKAFSILFVKMTMLG